MSNKRGGDNLIKVSMTGYPGEMNQLLEVFEKTGVIKIIRRTVDLEEHGSKRFKRVYLDLYLKENKK